MTRSKGAPPKKKPAGLESALDAAKRASTGQLLMRCARLVNERGLARASTRFGLPLRASHTTLLPHIALAGTRQTELAERLGVSKQAVHQLVAELEGLGVVERVRDPADARATLVRFTPRGARSLLDGLAVLAEIDREIAGVLGERAAASLHAALTKLDAWLAAEG